MRLFLAAEVPESHKLVIERALEPLRPGLPGVRWIDPSNWHLTLKFLGEVPGERVSELSRLAGAAAARTPLTRSGLARLGAFPSPRRARVLWVGLEDAGGALAALAGRLEDRLGGAGFRREPKPWRPHVTVGRLRVPAPVGKALEAATPGTLEAPPFPISEVVLFRSHLHPRGATYEALERFPFLG
jgi:2'-5' RNA ligase